MACRELAHMVLLLAAGVGRERGEWVTHDGGNLIAQIHAAALSASARMDTAGAVPACRLLERRFPLPESPSCGISSRPAGIFADPGTDDVGPDGIANVFDLF